MGVGKTKKRRMACIHILGPKRAGAHTGQKHTLFPHTVVRPCLSGGGDFCDGYVLPESDPDTHMSINGGVVIAVVANICCIVLTWLARIDSLLRLARGKYILYYTWV